MEDILGETRNILDYDLIEGTTELSLLKSNRIRRKLGKIVKQASKYE